MSALPPPIDKLPPIDKPFIDRVFASLEVMEVPLDTDPLEHGPKRLNSKIAGARKMLARTERIYLQVAHMLQQYKACHRGADLDFELGMQHLLANDPEVRAGRNVRDRDAIATMKLHDEKHSLAGFEAAIMDLEAVQSAVKTKRADLKDTQARLRDQIRLCGEEIGLGGRWGSKPSPGSNAPSLDTAPRVDVTTVDELRDLFQGSGAEIEAPPPLEDGLDPEKIAEIERVLDDVGEEHPLARYEDNPDAHPCPDPNIESILDGVLEEVLDEVLDEVPTNGAPADQNIEGWAGELNDKGPEGTAPVDLKEALPATDGDPEEVDEYLAAIDPSIPPRKIPNEISIDDLLGDL
jgi:hypothetical protein